MGIAQPQKARFNWSLPQSLLFSYMLKVPCRTKHLQLPKAAFLAIARSGFCTEETMGLIKQMKCCSAAEDSLVQKGCGMPCCRGVMFLAYILISHFCRYLSQTVPPHLLILYFSLSQIRCESCTSSQDFVSEREKT